MAIFEDVEFDWNGVTYRLSGDGHIMRALAAIEDHITIAELSQGQQKGNIPLAKLSSAYGAVLRQAGARVTDAEVYAGMWSGGIDAGRIAEAIGYLLEMMIPPQALQIEQSEDESGNASAPAARKKVSSKGRTKQRSSAGE